MIATAALSFSFQKYQSSKVGFLEFSLVGNWKDVRSHWIVSVIDSKESNNNWFTLQISDNGSLRENWEVIFANEQSVIG